MAARNHIELVDKTLRVLEALSERSQGMGLKDIASRVGLVKSSLFRILFTLRELGYVEQAQDNGSYRLTLKVLALARRPVVRPTLLSVARPHLARLRDELDESAWLAEWRRGSVVLIDVAEAPHPLQLSFDVGDQCPLHAAALGKVIAAYMSEEELNAALGRERLPRFTAHTITTRSDLAAELARVRRFGYAVNDEETVEGAVLLGGPVFDASGTVFAAVSVSCPTVRCTADKREAMAAALKRTTAMISEDLCALGFMRN